MSKICLHKCAVIALMSAMLSGGAGAQSTGRLIRPEDGERAKRVESLAISPDGSRLIYRENGLTTKGDKRESSLWSIDLSKSAAPVRFTQNASDSSVAWAPDGSRIAFLRDVKGKPQIHVMGAKGGEACPVTDISSGVEGFTWSPDGRSLAITSNDRAEGSDLPAGVRIFTRANYRSGSDYVDYSGTGQIWVAPVSASCTQAEARRLTSGALGASFAFWSRDSKEIYYTTEDVAETYYGEARASLHGVRVDTGKTFLNRRLVSPGSVDDDLGYAPEFVLSPDGKRAAFSLGNPDAPGDFAQSKIFIMDLASGKSQNVTAGYDREIGEGLVWRDDDHILALTEDEGGINLAELDLRKKTVRSIDRGQHVVRRFAVAAKTGKIVAVRTDFVSPAEVYEVSDKGAATQITSINREFREELHLTAPERISYRGPGGETIHGYLQKPPLFDPSQRYPLITLAHGGPYSMWDASFEADIQSIAAAGYLVFYPNPRGSSSYGQAYAAALSNSWPGKEFDDIMAGVDYLVSKPYVDGSRLGISGASAGGILTDWAITHTDRFKAAVSVSDIADNTAYWFVGDQPNLRRTKDGSAPWQDPRERETSAITYGLNIKTPTLFIGGDSDFRTPLSVGSEPMFRVLKYLKVPTALVQFEGAGHAISHGTDARHPGLAARYLIKWMDQYLKGIPAIEFADVTPKPPKLVAGDESLKTKAN